MPILKKRCHGHFIVSRGKGTVLKVGRGLLESRLKLRAPAAAEAPQNSDEKMSAKRRADLFLFHPTYLGEN